MSTANKKSGSRSSSSAKSGSKAKVKPAASATRAWTQSSAKLYPFTPFAAEGAQEATNAATRQMQNAAEQMMQYSNNFMQQMFAQSPFNGSFANPASFGNAALNGAKEKVSNAAREGADQFSRTATVATQSINEAVELSRENAETIVECGNIAVAASKQIAAEAAKYVNAAFAHNVELSKQILSCRTLNDMFDLQNKFVKSNLDAFFNESVKMSELMFQCATDVSEPLNERISETTERLSKVIAA
jgi:phasin family protein